MFTTSGHLIEDRKGGVASPERAITLTALFLYTLSRWPFFTTSTYAVEMKRCFKLRDPPRPGICSQVFDGSGEFQLDFTWRASDLPPCDWSKLYCIEHP